MFARIRYVLPMLLMALVALPLPTASAQQQKKAVAMLSVSSIDGLLGNVAYLTDAAGSPDIGQMAAMMSNVYLAGIDRANPVGMVLTTDGQEFLPLGFVPVKSLDDVFASLEESVGTPRKLRNGIMEIPGIQPIFVKEQNGFAFIGQTVESVSGDLPKDPAKLLGNMVKDYDIAIRGNIQNVPKEYIDMAVSALQDGVTQGMQQLPEEDRIGQEEMIQAQMKQMETYIKESDQITIGWKTEPANQRTFIDMSFTAVPGGALAKQMNAMAEAKSDFTGFILPDAAMTLSVATEIPPEQIKSSVDTLQSLKEAAMKEIDDDEKLDSPEARTAAKEMLGAALDIFVSTIETGKMDGGMSVVMKPGNISVLGGFHVADGKDVEEILKRLAEMAKDEPDFPGINFNADSASGVSFHTMSVPVPEEEEARKVLGPKLEMAVGTSKDSAYIGFGTDCVAKLKSVIAAQPRQASVPPFQMTISATPIMEFAAAMEENPLMASVTEALKESGNKDHVKLHGIPMKNGFTYRIELEEGILRGIGEAVKMANGGGF